MDFPLDNFITYPQSPGVEFPLNLAQDDLFPPGYLSTPDMDKLGSFPSESGQTNHTSPLGSDSHASTGLESVKTKTTKELKQVSLSTKQIKKKQLDQERAEKKDRELAQLLAKASKKYIPPALYDPNLDPKTKRHLIQVVKNRMAAQQTRDRRKAEVEEFDEVKQRLEDENKRLLDQNSYLMERLRKLEENQMRIMSENQHLKHQQANQAMQSSFMTQSQFMQNQAALNNSYMTQPSMSKSMQMPMPMQMSTNRSFVIDPSDEEKTLVNLVPGGAGPVLTRGTAKRTPFGYVFSLTTILLVFQSLTISPVPLSKQVTDPNNPPPDNGEIYNPTSHGGPKDPTNPGGLPNNPGDPAHGGGQPQDPPGSDFIPPVESGGTMSDPVSHDPVPGGDVGPIHVDVFEGNGTNTTTAESENNTGSETDNSTLDVIGPEDPLPPENSSETAIDPPDAGSDDEDRENIEGSSNLNRLLKRTESSSEEISLESILSRPKRFLGKLDDKINNELGRRH